MKRTIAAIGAIALAIGAQAAPDPLDPSLPSSQGALTNAHYVASALQDFGAVPFPVTFVTTNDVDGTVSFFLTSPTSGTFRVSVDGISNPGAMKASLVVSREGGDPRAFDFWSDGVPNAKATEVEFEEGGKYLLTLSLPTLTEDRYVCAVGIGLPDVQVAFDVNGGRLPAVQTNDNYTVGFPYACLPRPTRGNYDFGGWYTAAEGGSLISVTNLATASVTNLYAHWADPSNFLYNVVFDPNGGVGNVYTQQFHYGEAQALQANQFIYTNRMFVGWMTSKDGTLAYDDEQVVSNLVSHVGETCSLYAKWMAEVEEWHDDASKVLWRFTIDGENACIENCDMGTGTYQAAVSTTIAGAVAVPAVVKDEDGVSYVVTKIGERAFAGCAHVTKISIPDTVTSLGALAFLNCAALRTVDWPQTGVTSLPDRAFAGCSSLTSLEIPSTVTEIGASAFAGCTSLTSVTVPENVKSLGASAFDGCTSLRLVRYLGNPPTVEGSDGIYTNTPSDLVSAALVGRDGWSSYLSSSTNASVASTWQDRTLKPWTSSTYSLVRVIFDPAGGEGGSTNFYVKGHAYFTFPEEPEYADETAGDYIISHVFRGWFTAKTGGTGITEDSLATKSMRVYAQWATSVDTELSVDFWGLLMDDSYPLALTEAAVYDGFLINDNRLTGTVQVRVAKGVVQNGVTNSAVTAVVVRGGVSRTYTGTMKNGLTVKLSPRAAYDETDYLVLDFSALTMIGTSGEDGTEIQVTRTLLAKTSDYAFDPYAQFTNYYNNTVWTIAAELGDTENPDVEANENANGESVSLLRASLTIGAKGSVKIAGISPDGAVFSATAQLIVGDGQAYVPVSIALKDGSAVNALFVLDPANGTVSMDSTDVSSMFYNASGLGYSLTGEGGKHDWEQLGEVKVADSENAMVGVAYQAQVTVGALAYPVKFSARGLPPGLKIDATTGVISGVPTKAGTFTTAITVSSGVSAKEKPATQAHDMEIASLPSWASGTFTGYLTPAEDVTNRAPGFATMTVGTTGKVSGKIQQQGTNWTFSAASYDATSDSGFDELVIRAIAKAGKKTCPVELSVSEYDVLGTFGELNEGEEPNLVLWRGEGKDTSGLSDYVGYYTAVIEAKKSASEMESEDDSALGYGYLSLTVNSSASVRYTGKLPDGTAFSGTTPLVGDGMGAYAAVLYAAPSAYKGGYAFAVVSFDGFGSVSGDDGGTWINQAPTATMEYGSGFVRTLTVEGAYYSTADALADYYSTLAFAADQPELDVTVKKTDYDDDTGRKTTVSANEIASASEMTCWNSLTVSLNEKGTAFVVDQKKTTPVKGSDGEWTYEGENDAALTFSFTKATGIFRGSFTSWYDYESAVEYDRDGEELRKTRAHTSKKVSFEGVARQSDSDMKGFYLWKRSGTYDDAKTGKTKTFTYVESHRVEFK